jgi:hypothetical protein
MAYKRREPKHNWRSFLTAEERQEIETADRAKKDWERRWRKLSVNRARIMNRAIQRSRSATEGKE